MKWPWRRFEAMYEARSKRKAVEGAQAWKNAVISGLHANSNLDGEGDPRKAALDAIETSYQEILEMIYNGETSEEIDFKKDPFFAAMKVPGESTAPVPDRTTTTDQES